MESAIAAAVLPGHRIDGYRNSSPRLVRLLGLGEQGGSVARGVARRAFPNVEVRTPARPIGWEDVVHTGDDARINMVVIVCAEGDERLFRPDHGKTDMLVTFVLLQRPGDLPAEDERLANARGFSDLFVATSDADYVAELIDNLAS